MPTTPSRASTRTRRAAGVCTASSGNHAQAVALAARLHGIAATILMPTDAPASKRAAVDGYGAEVIEFDRFSADREALLTALAAERGATPIHAYDDERVIAGQGTAALELLEDRPELDVIFVPVGGGGLCAGTCVSATAIRPGIRVIGVEPAAGDDTMRSLEAGERVRIPVPDTIADGQQIPIPGEITFPILRRLVAEVTVATDEEIAGAMRFAFERLKLVVEPSGACALAALMHGRVDVADQRVGVILSGGNVDAARFASLIT